MADSRESFASSSWKTLWRARTLGLGSGITTSMRLPPCGWKVMSSTPWGFTRCFSTSMTWEITCSEFASSGTLTA